MVSKFQLINTIISLAFLASCNSGYHKSGGQWYWVTYDEYNGKKMQWLQDVDHTTFKVSQVNKNFGTDKRSAYFQGRKINYATSEGFTPLTKDAYGYSKDKYRVFFEAEVILKADPKSFTVLEFPYSKDKNDIYNGTLPMLLNSEDVATFEVTNDDELMSKSITTTLLSEFLKYTPEYRWIEDLDMEIKWVVTGRSGTAVSKNKKFKGLKEINKNI